jgi:Entner-Doudoroff aldolase
LKRESILNILAKRRLVAILRGDLKGRELEIVEALCESGIAAVEISIVSHDFDAVLKRMAVAFGSRIAIGAGTILTLDDLNRAITAGASFVVSPDGNCDVIEATLDAGLVSLPGAMTPTEIMQAQRWGADAVKLFPAGAFGPDYVRAVRAPFPDIRLVPTGGVRVEDLPAYWAAGAWAVGVGSELVNSSRIQDPDLVELRTIARAFAIAAENSSDDAR